MYFDIGTMGRRRVETKICCLIFLAGNITTLSHARATTPQVLAPATTSPPLIASFLDTSTYSLLGFNCTLWLFITIHTDPAFKAGKEGSGASSGFVRDIFLTALTLPPSRLDRSLAPPKSAVPSFCGSCISQRRLSLPELENDCSHFC